MPPAEDEVPSWIRHWRSPGKPTFPKSLADVSLPLDDILRHLLLIVTSSINIL